MPVWREQMVMLVHLSLYGLDFTGGKGELVVPEGTMA